MKSGSFLQYPIIGSKEMYFTLWQLDSCDAQRLIDEDNIQQELSIHLHFKNINHWASECQHGNSQVSYQHAFRWNFRYLLGIKKGKQQLTEISGPSNNL